MCCLCAHFVVIVLSTNAILIFSYNLILLSGGFMLIRGFMLTQGHTRSASFQCGPPAPVHPQARLSTGQFYRQ